MVTGPMFSGKTSELIRRVRRYCCAGKRCLVVKHGEDTRYLKEHVVTHTNTSLPAMRVERLSCVLAHADRYDVVAVDEGQFFDDLEAGAKALADRGKVVLVAALNGTFERRPFKQVSELMAACEGVQHLVAICSMCFRDAPFSKRVTGELDERVVGGADKYMAVCRTCYDTESTVAEVPVSKHE